MAATETQTKVQTEALPAGEFHADPVHSSVGFAVTHNGVSTFRGGFEDFDARLHGGERPSLTGTVDVSSIRVGDEQLKGHLLSPEFFDAQHDPRLRFDSTELSVDDSGATRLRGVLEIGGESHEIEASGRFALLGEDIAGRSRIGLSLSTAIDRRDYGLDWDAELPSGGRVLEFEVEIAVELELVEGAA
jgi:polyisoprenoid-binding protein YceI